MSKHKFKFILVGCLLAVFVVWLLPPGGGGANDEQKYQQMLRAAVWGQRLSSAERRLPGPLVRLCYVAKLKNKSMEKAHARAQALLASGYLTNTWITITNLPVTATNAKAGLTEVQRRLRAGLRGLDYWTLYMESNHACITCRSNDLGRVRRAVETP